MLRVRLINPALIYHDKELAIDINYCHRVIIIVLLFINIII